jgi:hypothetical protein
MMYRKRQVDSSGFWTWRGSQASFAKQKLPFEIWPLHRYCLWPRNICLHVSLSLNLLVYNFAPIL